MCAKNLWSSGNKKSCCGILSAVKLVLEVEEGIVAVKRRRKGAVDLVASSRWSEILSTRAQLYSSLNK
jgi:hypothetical protein